MAKDNERNCPVFVTHWSKLRSWLIEGLYKKQLYYSSDALLLIKDKDKTEKERRKIGSLNNKYMSNAALFTRQSCMLYKPAQTAMVANNITAMCKGESVLNDASDD